MKNRICLLLEAKTNITDLGTEGHISSEIKRNSYKNLMVIVLQELKTLFDIY